MRNNCVQVQEPTAMSISNDALYKSVSNFTSNLCVGCYKIESGRFEGKARAHEAKQLHSGAAFRIDAFQTLILISEFLVIDSTAAVDIGK